MKTKIGPCVLCPNEDVLHECGYKLRKAHFLTV